MEKYAELLRLEIPITVFCIFVGLGYLHETGTCSHINYSFSKEKYLIVRVQHLDDVVAFSYGPSLGEHENSAADTGEKADQQDVDRNCKDETSNLGKGLTAFSVEEITESVEALNWWLYNLGTPYDLLLVCF